ncbi:hypothetical protein [Streptomyces endophyticus]|uniref:Cellulase n=1 Tax=Streptomyces endophyticus TaxID=714166 RepID=A0ABU6FIN1_9ACTN|nr:hypothetical protein [Streptomyces endophyticus]MEB8343803.1 hypothetical protein [Streptomyces endophyticus]
MTPRTPPVRPADHAERPVEQRLREALAVRADSVTVRALRPARPPGPQLRRLPRLRDLGRRYALPVAGLATAAALAVGYVALAPESDPDRAPVPPAAPSSSTVPDRSPTPSPSPPAPSGSAVPSPATPSTSTPSASSPPPSSPSAEAPTATDPERPTAGASTPG